MLDVHAPEHTPHSWRDFFIHIATIVIGLIIAVGLEQTVEALHHHHEAATLREDLRQESDQIVRDAEGTDRGTTLEIDFVSARIQQVQVKVWQNRPLAPPSAPNGIPFDYPDDPIWRSAKTSGLVSLLHQDEVNAFSEVELCIAQVNAAYNAWRAAQSKRVVFEKQFLLLPNGDHDFSPASPGDMRTYLELLTAEAEACRTFYRWDREVLGAEDAIVHGHLQLQTVFDSERAFVRSKPL